MNSEFSYVIGIMSGTSLDGIDFVYVKFNKNDDTYFDILHSKTVSYSNWWKKRLHNALSFSKNQLNELDTTYGQLLGKETNHFISEFGIKKIDFIASHGHTILHQPHKGITLQVGNGQVIADTTKQKVVCDFRTQDVLLGGQGAPLVPIGDEALFSRYDYCLNLGGFANISYKKDDKRVAFDICPVNIVLNKYANKLGFEYDNKGHIAATGNYIASLDNNLRLLEYYKKNAPKSLGLEWVKKEIFPKLDSPKRSPEDLLATFTNHIAWAITQTIKKDSTVLITGGGAYNEYLISRIIYIKKVTIIIPNKDLIEYKEALIFAFLGHLKIQEKINCLQSVTGASKDHSSGILFSPKPI